MSDHAPFNWVDNVTKASAARMNYIEQGIATHQHVGMVYRVVYSGSWPARPTARTDVYVDWVGGSVQPPGMLSGDTWTPAA